MRLKVCQIIPTLVEGGAEKQLCLLASHLDSKRFESHVVVLTHSGPLEAQLRSSGVHVHVVGKRFKADPTALLRLTRLLKSIRPDIVQTWLFAANSYGRLAAARAKVPVVIASERCVDPWKGWLHHRIDRWLLRYTSALSTNSPGVVDFYSKHHIPGDMFRVVPNAILPPPPAITKSEFFTRLNIPPRKFVVIAVGRLWPQKGYPELIWASELLRVVLDNQVWLVIVGDGPEREKLMRLRDHYGSKDSVRFVGHRSDAQQLLTASDLLWNGSLYEGQSNTILEAMSAGVPCLATDIPGNRDLIVHDKTGILYPQGDVGRLARESFKLLSNLDMLKSFQQENRIRVAEEFSLERMIQGYEQLYEQLWQDSKSRIGTSN